MIDTEISLLIVFYYKKKKERRFCKLDYAIQRTIPKIGVLSNKKANKKLNDNALHVYFKNKIQGHIIKAHTHTQIDKTAPY